MRFDESPSSKWRPKIKLVLNTLVGLMVAVMCGCGGKIPQTHYYTLQIPPPAATADPQTHFTLGVERFRAVEPLENQRILYYASPSELNYYAYHEWAEDPASMISELVERRLQSANLFSQVRLYPRNDPGDFALQGRLLNFEEVDDPKGGKARVALALTLIRTRDQKTVWTETREADSPIEQKGFGGIVGAMNAATDRLLSGLLPELSEAVAKENSINSTQ